MGLSADTGEGFTVADTIQAATDVDLVNSNGGFMYVFLGGLTANIAFWATMALNIPDFSRYAKSQKAQFRGQLYGMPLMMAICAFIGAYFAQSTKLVFGEAMFDPTGVLALLDSKVLPSSSDLVYCFLDHQHCCNLLLLPTVSPTFFRRDLYKTGVLLTVFGYLYLPVDLRRCRRLHRRLAQYLRRHPGSCSSYLHCRLLHR